MRALWVLILTLLLSFFSAAVADYVPFDVKWDNGVPSQTVAFGDDYCSDLLGGQVGPNIVADDFQCNETGHIYEIQWWGSYFLPEDPIRHPDYWRIAWWEYRAPGEDGIPFSHPRNLLLENDVIARDLVQLWYDDSDPTKDVYHYYASLPEPCWFWQERDQMYFLSIQAGWNAPVPTDEYWGWHEAPQGWQWNDDAVHDLTEPWWDGDMEPIERAGESRDMAFQLGVPEPGTLCLLGFGLAGLALVRRRRRTA